MSNLIKLAAIINYTCLALVPVIITFLLLVLNRHVEYWTVAGLLGSAALELVLIVVNGILVAYLERKFGI